MKFLNTFVLARSKLCVRRLRTAVTIVVSGLLFGVTIMLLVVIHSSLASTDKFNDSLFGGKYFAFANNFNNQAPILTNTTIETRAKQIYRQTIAAKIAEAEKLGIPYDTQSEIYPISSTIEGDAQTPSLNLESPSAQQAVAEYKREHPDAVQSNLTKVAAIYHASHTFQVDELHPMNGTSTLMRNGIEVFGSTAPDDFMTSVFPRVIDDSVAKPFMTTTVSLSDKTVPILVPTPMAERLLNLAKLSPSASPSQKLDRLNELKTKTTGLTFSVCYRNETSKSQVDTAASTPKSPSAVITYGLPSAADCAPAAVIKDDRSPTQKTLDVKQQEFDAMFGGMGAPIQRKVQFKVIGILPGDTSSLSGTESITEVAQSFLFGPSQLGTPMIPLQSYQKTQAAKLYSDIYVVSPDILSGSKIAQSGYLVEFTNKDDLGQFITERSCSGQQITCQDSQKPFPLTEFGTTSVKATDIMKIVENLTTPVLIGVVVVSAIIMAGTFGQIIADSRREIAVFRAVGASKGNIATIFVLYGFFLSLIVAGFTLAVGMIGSFIFDAILSQQATITAYATYGLVNNAFRFRFVTIDIAFVWWVPAVAIVTGILSMLLALPSAMNHTVIEDIRDE